MPATSNEMGDNLVKGSMGLSPECATLSLMKSEEESV